MVKLYDVVRTAHLERVLPGSRTTILHRHRRYDFDPALAQTVDLRVAGVIGVFRYMLTHPFDVIEVNEPLIARAAPRTLAAVLGNRLVARLRDAPRARIVSYAIASLDPSEIAHALPWRARLRWRLQALLVPAVWRAIDRLAFGTPSSRDVYLGAFDGRLPTSRLVLALPSAADGVETGVRSSTVIYLGDLSERKGFPLVADVWGAVLRAEPGARLRILGQGSGAPLARELADGDRSVEFLEAPDRSTIFASLMQAKVLVLPSQPAPLWREQVGLPIVEGLAAGCLVVTTEQTGLADWLGAHGHQVVPSGERGALAGAIVDALRSCRTPVQVCADLPTVDGRAEAERWLLEGLR